MAKQIQSEERVWIAPNIIGWLDENGQKKAKDIEKDKDLDPSKTDDKIMIYQRQVKEWFLTPATKLLENNDHDYGFIVLMICISYFEGNEILRADTLDDRSSGDLFKDAVKRLYPHLDAEILKYLWQDARNGLFHDGMTRGKIRIDKELDEAIKFERGRREAINPKLLLNDIIKDFENYLDELHKNTQLRRRFELMYQN